MNVVVMFGAAVVDRYSVKAMQAISQFIQGHMVLVFFIYGLSFFLLGAAVFFQVRRGTGFRIGKYLWLLAGFGLLHGLNEWLDMFLLLGNDYWSTAGTKTIEVIRFFVGKISYVFLFLFGAALLVYGKPAQDRVLRVSLGTYSVMIIALLVWGIATQFSPEWFLSSDTASRYGLALPAAFMTALAFFSEWRSAEIRDLNSPTVSSGLAGLGITFLLYAIFAGVIVKSGSFFPASILNYKTFMAFTGFPVQFFRAGCAIAMVVFLCKVLRIFALETERRLQTAYREIMRISNREQMRIGQDLHDGLGQELAGIACMTKALESKLKATAPANAKAAEDIRDLLDRSIDTTRALSRGLCPVSLEKHGLGFALRELADTTEKLFSVPCTAVVAEIPGLGGSGLAIQLFRIAQEAVSNAVKHAKANEIRIELTTRGKGATLSVVDDGIGLPEDLDRTTGIGLRIMRYRAGVIDWQLGIDSKSGQGTTVHCRGLILGSEAQ